LWQVSCAILFAQLEGCEGILSARLDNFSRYYSGLEALAQQKLIRLPQVPAHCQHNAHIFYVIFQSAADRLVAEREFKDRGISAFSHYVPLHSAAAGRKYGRVGASAVDSQGQGQLKVTDAVFEGLLRLPIWIGLRLDEINYVIQAVHEVCAIVAAHNK
jgi:dTDP-4-amino-4,6-dideoxygalactose transaminase